MFKTLCTGDPKKKWGVVVAQHAANAQNQANFETCIEMFLRQYMDREISLDTKKWLMKVKKPKDMKVQTFLARLCQINDLIPYMPFPLNDNVQPPKYEDPELAGILHDACPRAWSRKQAEANLSALSINAQANYYQKLKRLEDSAGGNNNNNNNNNNRSNKKQSGSGKNNNNRRNNNNNNGTTRNNNKICPIRSWTLSRRM